MAASVWFSRVVLFTAMLTLLIGGDCGPSSEPSTRERKNIDIQLTNLPGGEIPLPVHIFAPGETFPCCRLDPGASRGLVLELGDGDDVTFAAGRNGELIASVRCNLGSRGFSAARAEVHWSSVALTCVGWS